MEENKQEKGNGMLGRGQVEIVNGDHGRPRTARSLVFLVEHTEGKGVRDEVRDIMGSRMGDQASKA